MLGRTFESEADALKSVERSRAARRRPADERRASAQKAAATHKRKRRERYQADRAARIRQRCRVWDDRHAGEREVRARQSPQLKRRTREQTNQAIEAKKLKADWSYGLRGPRAVCERCWEESAKIEAHHGEYSDPMTVCWLCGFCHGAVYFDEQDAHYWSQTTGARIAAIATAELYGDREIRDLTDAERHRVATWAGLEVALRAGETARVYAVLRMSEAISLAISTRK